MRPHAPPPLLLLLLAAAALAGEPATTATLTDDPQPLDGTTTLSAKNDTAVDETQPLLNRTVVLDDATNGTLAETDDDHEPVVRKKRTFGDLVFRGLADVLGYNVARKPAQNAFPPPLPPVPGIDTPLQAAPAPAPAPAPAQVPPPCGAPRAAGPPPCRAQLPPPPPPPPPCPKPRAAPTPRPPPPPPPPPPCGNGRANPTTPSPCGPAPPPPPPPKDNLERISSNFRLDFNFLRSTPAPQGAAVEAQQQQLAETPVAAVAPVAIQPRAAKLPLEEPRNPRVYVDAFVVRNGVAQRVNTVDARRLDPQRAPLEDDYLAYDDEAEALAQNLDDEDDYEDAQESQGRAKAVKDFSVAVDNFWDAKAKQGQKKQPALNYKNVHFGDRDLVNQIRRSGKQDSHQSLQRTRPKANRIPQPQPEAPEDDAEVTTSTEDPRRPLKPRVLPPTEQNPGEIDTVTVRVPPIYKEKRPKKLHRERPEDRQDHDRSDHDEHHHNRPHYDRSDRGRPDRDYDRSEEVNQSGERNYYYQENDTNGEDSSNYPQTEKPVRRKRRRKVSRKTRSINEKDPFTAGDYDYYGKKLPISDEEKYFRGLTVPEPTKDADLARLEKAPEGREDYFLDDHERLREDPERIIDDDRLADDKGRADESGRLVDARDELSESERIVDEDRSDESERAGNEERSGEGERSDERERTDRLSPNARVHETGYRNNFVHATNVQVESPTPSVATIKKKSVKIGS